MNSRSRTSVTPRESDSQLGRQQPGEQNDEYPYPLLTFVLSSANAGGICFVVFLRGSYFIVTQVRNPSATSCRPRNVATAIWTDGSPE